MEENDPGPLDVVVLKFTGNEFTGEIAAVLRDLAIRHIVRVIDVLFVSKDGDGTTRSLELGALRPDLDPLFVDVDGQLGGGLLDAEDVDAVAAHLEPGSSMAVVAVENVWATRSSGPSGPPAASCWTRPAFPPRCCERLAATHRREAGVSLMGIVTKIDGAAVDAGPATAVSERMTRRHTAPAGHRTSARRPQAGPAPATGADALAAELRRLDALRQQGVLTAEEHALAKAKLVGL